MLRAATYNVHACIGNDRRFRPGRTADVIESLEAEFVGLQEVEERVVDGHPVSALLAKRLDMHAYTGPTLRRGAADYGNMLLSRVPASAVRRIDLSVKGREPRGAIDADFDIGGLKVRVVVTHFGLIARERGQQVDVLLDALDENAADVLVLMADFNSWRRKSRVHRRLARRFGTAPRPRTFPSFRPLFALDAIYTHPAGAMSAVQRHRAPGAAWASDHLPVIATLLLNQDQRNRHVEAHG